MTSVDELLAHLAEVKSYLEGEARRAQAISFVVTAERHRQRAHTLDLAMTLLKAGAT
jgi:hypothetical protein